MIHSSPSYTPVSETPAHEAAALRVPSGPEPFYVASGDEVSVFERCHARGLPVMLKGPTGCGKTRFVERVAWRLMRPLVTVSSASFARSFAADSPHRVRHIAPDGPSGHLSVLCAFPFHSVPSV